MMWLSRREIRRQADLPSFREYVRAARAWELLFLFALPAVWVGSFLLPWAITGSPISGLLGIIGFGVLWCIASIPILIITAVRHPEPIGTHWDGKQWKYGRPGKISP